MDQLIIDSRDKKLAPCGKCQEVISENLQMISKDPKKKRTKVTPESREGREFWVDEDFDAQDFSDYEGLSQYDGSECIE